jgi:hypothetical protein
VSTGRPGTPLRCCGGCGGSFLGDNRDEIWFCPKCARNLPDFDPQPYGRGRLSDQSCRYEGRLMVVLDREGDEVSVRPLGNPSAPPVIVHINNLRPAYITPGH